MMTAQSVNKKNFVVFLARSRKKEEKK